MNITNLAEFKGWIRTQLGGGYISTGSIVVELTDEHIESCIHDAIEYAYEAGLYDSTLEDYIQINLSAGVSTYDVSAIAPDATEMLFLDAGLANMGGPSVLFSPINLLYGGQNPVTAYGMSYLQLTSFEVFSQYLSLVNRMFAVEFRLNYNQYTKQLRVVPTPTENMTAVVKTYNKTAAASLFQNPWVKQLALANARIIWGTILSKYKGIDLPGRGSAAEFGESMMHFGMDKQAEYMKKMEGQRGFYGIFIG